ncbi:MAG: hypothetical protein HY043_16535, partial [Verrucomicrobia bacterium]|nr:hypothetical protein [Verrucomicrobiota bacterium]
MLRMPTCPAQPIAAGTNPPNAQLAKKFADAFAQLPPTVRHYEGVTEAEVADRLGGEKNFQNIIREKVAQRWFAALVAIQPGRRFQITERFATLKELLDFVQQRQAIVDVSAYSDDAAHEGKGRRIPATELAEIKRELHEQPLLVSLMFKDAASGELRDERVEFGFGAAASVLAMNRAYERHRHLQITAHDILRARDANGEFNAQAQWDALKSAVDAQRVLISELPERPLIAGNLFVAFEFAVDEFGNFTNVVRAYRESDVQRRIVPDAGRHSIQVLALQHAGAPEAIAGGFRARGTSDELEAVPNPITGQDVVELRVKDANEPDTRRWHVLEFGEPEVLQQSALAKFGLITAHLEAQRKQLALRRTRWSLFAEPVFAGLNIGGGASGVPFPLGEAARLFYDAAFGPMFIPQLPTVKELRELFLLLAAKDKHPRLRVVPADFLTEADVRELRAAMKNVTDADAEAFLQRTSDTDLQAMQKLAKWQNLDAKYSLLSSLLIDAAKVSGASESGWMKDILNNSRATISGDVSVKTILAMMMGGKTATPFSGVSLKKLARGEGPGAAWLQFLDVSIDLRTVFNTVTRLAQDNERDRELRKPFPYAPRADELAAYEFRIFGYPLLMWYKRGLLKEDVAAYQNDYAYGIVGTHIVEHFATKEAMLGELRAGRLAPLGFVRVGDGKGGTAESRLVVFAHQVPDGKHRGQTALIIYGLKAFSDYAVEMEHELERFREYERVIQDGGVIEKLMRAESPGEIPSGEFAPKIRTDADASREFAALLGGLRELERYRQLKKWGAPASAEEEQRGASLRAELARLGIRADDPSESPFLGADRFSSSLLYKKFVNGHWREVKLTLIPSLADIDRELKKAETAQRLESMRRLAVSPQGDGIVLLNEIRERDGRLEIGPIARGADGQIFSTGIRAGATALGEVFAQLNQFPITNQARLLFNQFATTPVELELDGGGKQKVFLTVEFPIDRELQTEQINPLSGEPEISRYQNGRRTGLVTDRRVVELAYDDANIEARGAVFLNRGTRQQPIKGPLLEETRTVEAWFRETHLLAIDPSEARIARLRVNHVTGQTTRETFGLFPQPTEVADDLYLTRNQFDAYGLFDSATVVENGKTDSDFQRAELERVLRPISGRERFRLAGKNGGGSSSSLNDLKGRGFLMEVEQTDVIKNLATTLVFDLSRFGRRTEARWVDAWAATNNFRSATRFEYRDDFEFGMIPQRAITRGEATGAVLAQVETTAYDPLTRQLTGAELEHTGKRTRKVWDARWQNPIRVESDLRTTSYSYNRDETEIAGSTHALAGDQKLSEFAGRFDAATPMWKSSRTNFFRPQIPSRTETETRSGFGKLIATATGDLFEARPNYDAAGRETGSVVRRRNPATGQFDILHRQEDDYQWRNGTREARVRTFVDGLPHDTFRIITDAEGRTTTDGIKRLPGLELQTTVAFDGASDRPARAELRQNGAVRLTREYLPEVQSTNGAWLLPAKAVPYWGLTSTQFVRLDDPLARPQATHFENGEHVEVIEWYQGTSVARISKLFDRRGRAKERFATEVRAGEENGLSYDLLHRFKMNFWGDEGLAEEKAVVRGTDVSFFKTTIDEKTYYDISKVYDSPLYTIDRQDQAGITVTINGARRQNVLTLYRGGFLNWPPAAQTNATTEPLLQLQQVDLRGLFFHKYSKTDFDRAGNLLEEIVGKIPNPGQGGYADSAIFDSVGRASANKRFHYAYNPGQMVEQSDPQTGRRMLALSETALGNGAPGFAINSAPWRETVTRITGQQADSQEELFATNRTPYIFRRIINPRERELNPHLPGETNHWTAWTATELAADGSKLFDTETFFDAQGRVRVMQSHKTNSGGQPAIKTVYSIADPPAGVFKEHRLGAGKTTVPLELTGQADFSGSDFVYFYVANPDRASFSLAAKDAAGREAKIYRRDSEDRQDGLLTWAIESANIRWLPDVIVPAQGALINAPASLAKTGRVIALSVHDLAQGGLDIRRVTSVAAQVNGRAGSVFSVSPLFHLARGAEFVRDAESFKFSYAEENHSSGLKTFTKTRKQRTEAEALADLFQNSVTELNGRAVALGHTRSRSALFPVTVVMDNSDPDSPDALYAMVGTDGRFLEFYKTIKRGDAQVYSVVSGFEIPRVDVTRAAILDDEITPGYVAYGNNYLVRGELAKGRGLVGGAFANFHNRIVANAFKFGADQFLKSGDTKRELANDFSRLHNASTQAETINALPMLAQALLAQREVPWKTPSVASAQDWAADRAPLRIRLQNLHTNYATGLLPTAPETTTEVFVDTVKEGALIQLAIELKATGVARDLLNFYRERFQAASEPLHAAYDARTGAALQKDPNSKRAQVSPRTAAAHLAIAEAAFRYGVEVPGQGYQELFTLGKDLTWMVLTNFMMPGGGITENPLIVVTNRAGVALWPEPERFTLRSNARAYLLFRNLTNIMGRYSASGEWGLKVREALRQQQAWLMTNIVPQLERTGVAPKGLFQIQDIYDQTTALGVERWTAAEDWLVFLEAADAMGIPKEKTRHWLENLAMVHGVTVDGKWGLDWSIALTRPDAISPELTVKFWRVAKVLGHDDARDLASRQLSLLRTNQNFPAVVTRARPDKAIESGQGFPIQPHRDRKAWPMTLAPFAELFGTPWDLSRQHQLATVQNLPPLERPFKDTTVWLWCAGIFYGAVVAFNFFWWMLRFWRQRHRAAAAHSTGGGLVPSTVMDRVEERWAKRVLGVCTPAGAEKTRFSNATVEVNFHMQLRAIYKLVLEWRRLENGWDEHDARLIEGDTDEWLNGLDEFASLVGIYMRWVIKAGLKDGFTNTDALAEHEDSNHIWSRLLMYLSEYYWGMTSALHRYDNAVTPETKAAASREVAALLNDMGLREREESFDARDVFNVPANPNAFDLLVLQKPGMTLTRVVDELSAKLNIPRGHIVRFVKQYKEFKRRENICPLHPYLIEAAKLLPHFLLMGLGALVWYNEKRVGDEPLLKFVWEKLILAAAENFFSWPVAVWAVPLLLGAACSVYGHWVKIYRWQASMQLRAQSEVWIYQTMTSFFTRTTAILPEARKQWWWNPTWFERVGWSLRAIGFLGLGVVLLRFETPNFVTFLLVKGILAMLAFIEVGAIVLPAALSLASKFLQDWVAARPQAGGAIKFLHSLNITATRPTSVLWQSFRYHFQATAPSGDLWGLLQTIFFYFLQAGVFFFVGGYLCQEMFPLWFTEKYLAEADWKLFFGGLIFWNTMYLLRYGLFLLATGIGSFLATFPLRTIGAALALAQIAAVVFGGFAYVEIGPRALASTAALLVGLALMLFEEQVLAWVRGAWPLRGRANRQAAETERKLARIKQDQSATLGVIYMSGDDLCYQKLTPTLLMSRWRILRDKLDSET